MTGRRDERAGGRHCPGHTPLWLFPFAWLLCISQSMANISAPPEPNPGHVTGNSPMGQLTVLHEELTLDLSGVARGERVKVTANYRLQSPATVHALELIFVANNLSGNKYRVALDGRLLAGHLRQFDTIPAGWLPPDSIRGVAGTIPFAYTHEGLIAFRIDRITPGTHTLHVAYEADAGEWFGEDDLVVTRTFVYILKPSTGWKQFKSLRANIIVPDGWDYTSNLPLAERESGDYRGDWTTLPAHHFAIAMRKSTGAARAGTVLFLVIAGIAWYALGTLAGRWMKKVARYRIRRNDSRILQLINDLFISLPHAVCFYVVYFLYFEVLERFLGGQLNPWMTRGIGYSVLLFPLVWIVVLGLTIGVDYRLTQRVKKELVAVPGCE